MKRCPKGGGPELDKSATNLSTIFSCRQFLVSLNLGFVISKMELVTCTSRVLLWGLECEDTQNYLMWSVLNVKKKILLAFQALMSKQWDFCQTGEGSQRSYRWGSNLLQINQEVCLRPKCHLYESLELEEQRGVGGGLHVLTRS